MNGRAGKRTSSRRKWAGREDAILEKFYPHYEKISRRLKTRSYHAIKSRARKLEISVSRHVWTNQEVSRIIDLYSKGKTPAEISVTFPYLTAGQIAGKAQHLNLRRARRKCYLLGIPPIDAVRERAAELGWTWRKLDRLADTGRYFQQTTRQVNWAHLAKAIAMLGGQIQITWPKDQQPARSHKLHSQRAAPILSPHLPSGP